MDRQMERQRVTRAGVEQGPSTLAGVGGPEVGQGASGPAHTALHSGCGISLGQSAAVVEGLKLRPDIMYCLDIW